MTGKRTWNSADFEALVALEALRGADRRDRVMPIAL